MGDCGVGERRTRFVTGSGTAVEGTGKQFSDEE